MEQITLTTYDWVPELPRGYVRDLRLRWALEEAGLPYEVASTPFRERGPDHLRHQPFGQVPWLTVGTLSIFESGAALLHVAEASGMLLPDDPQGRQRAISWLFAALNSVEMAVLPFTVYQFAGDTDQTPGRQALDRFLAGRLDHVEGYLGGPEGAGPAQARDWLAGSFSIADIAMADVLRLADRFDALSGHPACRAYVARATARPAFEQAFQDQLAHFAAAD